MSSGIARASDARGPLVVVISHHPDAPFVRRLAAELALFGYQVEVAARGGNEQSLVQLLERWHGAALISVDQGNQTAQIVVANSDGRGASRHERERLDPRRRADTNAAVLAERFRARLTELGIAPTPQLPLQVATEPVRTAPPVAEAEKRLWLIAAVGGTSGGLGFLPELSWEVRAFPVRWLSTSAFFKLSPLSARVEAAEGVADVRLLAGGVLIDAYPVQGGVDLKLGLGATLVNAHMKGSAEPPWGGREDSVLVPAAVARGGVVLRLSKRLAAELDAFVGLCAPRIGVRFAGNTVASFGQPYVGAALGGSVGVF